MLPSRPIIPAAIYGRCLLAHIYLLQAALRAAPRAKGRTVLFQGKRLLAHIDHPRPGTPWLVHLGAGSPRAPTQGRSGEGRLGGGGVDKGTRMLRDALGLAGEQQQPPIQPCCTARPLPARLPSSRIDFGLPTTVGVRFGQS